jgi:hypothetical protein
LTKQTEEEYTVIKNGQEFFHEAQSQNNKGEVIIE